GYPARDLHRAVVGIGGQDRRAGERGGQFGVIRRGEFEIDSIPGADITLVAHYCLLTSRLGSSPTKLPQPGRGGGPRIACPKDTPAAIWANEKPPTTRTGEDRLVVLLSPNDPGAFLPQVQASPFAFKAAEISSPAAIEVKLWFPTTSTGEERFVAELSPSSPKAFVPQAHTLPSAFNPSVWYAPQTADIKL